jgi:hypothetical protein
MSEEPERRAPTYAEFVTAQIILEERLATLKGMRSMVLDEIERLTLEDALLQRMMASQESQTQEQEQTQERDAQGEDAHDVLDMFEQEILERSRAPL